jgi:fructokinase
VGLDKQDFSIVGLGEALFDCIGDSKILGGAPLNVAIHAGAMLAGAGGTSVVASRVGDDDLGQRVRRELQQRGIDASYLQRDPTRPTGDVRVYVNAHGQPEYEITANVAWDYLEFDSAWRELARKCTAVCFGTLAQRCEASRKTIRDFLATATNAIRLLDLNLRQDYYDAELIRCSLELANVLKLNEDELYTLSNIMGIPTAATLFDQLNELAEQFSLSQVALTCGAKGATLLSETELFTGRPVIANFGSAADTVGAGDASSAALIAGLLLELEPQDTVQLMNKVGAFVAGQSGATPPLPTSIINGLKQAIRVR